MGGRRHADGEGDHVRPLHFVLPFTAPDPQLVDPGLGIRRFTRMGHHHSYTIEVTILDTPDHRLVRAGIMLAHRVSRGLGDWYLAASAWTPPLPGEVTVPIDAGGDLPDELAELVRVFRRLAPLGPVATLSRERVVHLIRGDATESDAGEASGAGAVLGSVRDDRVTVRRGGVVISRSREVTVEPEPALTAVQREHLVTVLQATGASRVTGFPALAQRLGAPATRPTDIPAPRPRREARTLGEFVSRLLARHLRRIVDADLRLRTGTVDTPRTLIKRLRLLDRDLTGIARLLDPGWHDAVQAHLAVVLAGHPDAATLWRHEDHYLAALDALVEAVQAPPVGERVDEPAARELKRLRRLHADEVAARCDELSVDIDDAAWQAASRAVATFARAAAVAAVVGGGRAKDISRRARRLESRLERAAEATELPSPAAVGAMSPVEAFAAGRDVQRRVDEVGRNRAGFVADWPARRAGLGGAAGRG